MMKCYMLYMVPRIPLDKNYEYKFLCKVMNLWIKIMNINFYVK